MSNYRVWNPWLVSAAPALVELFVTTRDAFWIGDGTEEFVARLLRDAGIDDAPSSWALVRCRSPYFSPSPDPDDWEDRWRLAWKVRATLPRVPAHDLSIALGCAESDAWDASYLSERHDAPGPARCVIVADFRDVTALESAAAAIVNAAEVSLTRGCAHGRFPQLHVDLGDRDDAYYAAGAPEALELLASCHAHGASTHHEDTWAWSAERA